MDDVIVAAMPPSGLPSLVSKRDGRLVPFEADNISQSVFAATEELGQPSAFLARELTDGVLHFLAAEVGADPPSTLQIAELVAKVVRELGQPTLAQVYASRHQRHQETAAGGPRGKTDRSLGVFHFSTRDDPGAVSRQCLRAYSLQVVFARDVAAAHEEGLIVLTGLEHPEELARLVVEPCADKEGWVTLFQAPARMLGFDSPQYALTE